MAVIGGGWRLRRPGMETSARDRNELGRIRRSHRRVMMSFGDPFNLSFGLGGFRRTGPGGAGGWRRGVAADPARGFRRLVGQPARVRRLHGTCMKQQNARTYAGRGHHIGEATTHSNGQIMLETPPHSQNSESLAGEWKRACSSKSRTSCNSSVLDLQHFGWNEVKVGK
jgi:hypothetical protein